MLKRRKLTDKFTQHVYSILVSNGISYRKPLRLYKKITTLIMDEIDTENLTDDTIRDAVEQYFNLKEALDNGETINSQILKIKLG